MSEMSNLDKFLKEREKKQIPSGDVARVKLLARELALGVHRNLWGRRFFADRGQPYDELKIYFEKRWNVTDGGKHDLGLLQGYGYVIVRPNSSSTYEITRDAFELLKETEPYNVFISYKHSESSAFALLVVARLKEYGLVPFCDMSLIPGEDWHPELEKQIDNCSHFIVLIGKKTHNSKATLKEIQWAKEKGKTIIPIWHNKFEFKKEDWNNKEYPDVASVIQKKQAIEVTKESAGGYNRAIVELLNRFGLTP